jgi:hypothetical protein
LVNFPLPIVTLLLMTLKLVEPAGSRELKRNDRKKKVKKVGNETHSLAPCAAESIQKFTYRVRDRPAREL